MRSEHICFLSPVSNMRWEMCFYRQMFPQPVYVCSLSSVVVIGHRYATRTPCKIQWSCHSTTKILWCSFTKCLRYVLKLIHLRHRNTTRNIPSSSQHGNIRTAHTTYAAALKTTTHPNTRCRKPYAATQHPVLLMMCVYIWNMSS